MMRAPSRPSSKRSFASVRRSGTHDAALADRPAGLAVTTDGLPLGLAAIKFWTRAKFKGTNALKRRVNPTRVPIEAKESINDIYFRDREDGYLLSANQILFTEDGGDKFHDITRELEAMSSQSDVESELAALKGSTPQAIDAVIRNTFIQRTLSS